MSKRKFFESLNRFSEQLALMSGWARRKERESWMGTIEDDRTRVRQALAKVKEHWILPDSEACVLEGLVLNCLYAYERGDNDSGDTAYRDISEYEQFIRDLAYKPRNLPTSQSFNPGPASNEPEA